tara:strand:- start:90 stop:464 length:375 start_codon:yes stop_codon:yes gene_type:complete
MEKYWYWFIVLIVLGLLFEFLNLGFVDADIFILRILFVLIGIISAIALYFKNKSWKSLFFVVPIAFILLLFVGGIPISITFSVVLANLINPIARLSYLEMFFSFGISFILIWIVEKIKSKKQTS